MYIIYSLIGPVTCHYCQPYILLVRQLFKLFEKEWKLKFAYAYKMHFFELITSLTIAVSGCYTKQLFINFFTNLFIRNFSTDIPTAEMRFCYYKFMELSVENFCPPSTIFLLGSNKLLGARSSE